MPINAGYEYIEAEKNYLLAKTVPEKIAGLEEMMRVAPKHKGSENLLENLRNRVTKLKRQLEKAQASKKTAKSLSIKKEGVAQIVLVGPTQSGKSTLLKKLTNANVTLSSHLFTTKKPEVGITDYYGIKLQIVEIPAIVNNFRNTALGPTLLSIIRQSDLIVLLFNTPEEKKLLDKELFNIDVKRIIYDGSDDFKEKIWNALNLIKVSTKQPGKKPDFPPVALEKNANVKELASQIHKDFIKKFKYARIFGPSAKFKGQQVGLTHKLKDGDAVELHTK